jgi:Mlc titration factor MtfA (ptsG expression regulator)
MIDGIRYWWRERQAARLCIAPELWASTEQSLPFLRHLNSAERDRLRQLARELIAEKEWAGAQGLQLTANIQLAIALQACLPVLNLGLDWYSDWVGIVVYPGDFVIPRQSIDENGVVHEYDDAVLGEAWAGGPVLISWFDHAEDIDGINVVIHEFAHKLDMRNGAADGVPPLPAEMSRANWIAAMEHAYLDLQQRADNGEVCVLDPYGAESPAEFFAVASEAFFQTPTVLQTEYPQVFTQLRRFYRQNPAAINTPTS